MKLVYDRDNLTSDQLSQLEESLKAAGSLLDSRVVFQYVRESWDLSEFVDGNRLISITKDGDKILIHCGLKPVEVEAKDFPVMSCLLDELDEGMINPHLMSYESDVHEGRSESLLPLLCQLRVDK